MNFHLKKIILVFLITILAGYNSFAQQYVLPPSAQYRPDRFKKVIITEAIGFVLTSTGLYYLWYKKFPKSRFHFINDNREWFQIDKAGHATTAYNIAVIQHDLLRWSGVSPRQAIIGSAATSLAFLSIVEIMDGFSKGWGFSKGDMVANITGTTIFAAQQHWWGEQRVSMKFSASFSPYAKYNPNLLGKQWASRLMKDYNGQTYWLSVNPHTFAAKSSKIPAWLNISFGYGGDGMIGANNNPELINGKQISSFTRRRQFYIAPDADLYRIKSLPAVNSLFYSLQFLKMPAPAIEIDDNGKIKMKLITF